MQQDAQDQPHRCVQRAEREPQHTERQARHEDPFQSPPQEQSSQRKHRQQFRRLAQRHPAGGMLKTELLQLRRGVRIERAQRYVEQRGSDEYDPMVTVLQQRQRIPAKALLPGGSSDIFRWRHTRYEQRKNAHAQVRRGRYVKGRRRSIRTQCADCPEAAHPTECGSGADRAKFTLRTFEAGQNDARGKAESGCHAQRVQLDQN